MKWLEQILLCVSLIVEMNLYRITRLHKHIRCAYESKSLLQVKFRKTLDSTTKGWDRSVNSEGLPSGEL